MIHTFRNSVTKIRCMTVIDEDPVPYTNRPTMASVNDPTYTAQQNMIRPDNSRKNSIKVMKNSFFVLSTEWPTKSGISIDGMEAVASNTPKPAGEMTSSLIMYKPKMENVLFEKCPPNEIHERSIK